MFQTFEVFVSIEGSQGISYMIVAVNKAHAEIIVRNHYELNKLSYEHIMAVEKNKLNVNVSLFD